MRFMLPPCQILLATLVGGANESQQRTIEYQNDQIKVLLKRLGKKRVLLSEGQQRVLAVIHCGVYPSGLGSTSYPGRDSHSHEPHDHIFPDTGESGYRGQYRWSRFGRRLLLPTPHGQPEQGRADCSGHNLNDSSRYGTVRLNEMADGIDRDQNRHSNQPPCNGVSDVCDPQSVCACTHHDCARKH